MVGLRQAKEESDGASHDLSAMTLQRFMKAEAPHRPGFVHHIHISCAGRLFFFLGLAAHGSHR